MSAHLSKARKEELSEKALAMSCKGRSYTYISEELEVNWKTAKRLVAYALEKRDINHDEERERSLAHHREVIRWCWEQLEDEKLMAHAQNRPSYIARIQHSISEIDRLNGIRPAENVNLNINQPDYSQLSDDELRIHVGTLRKLRGARERSLPSRN